MSKIELHKISSVRISSFQLIKILNEFAPAIINES